MRELPAVLRMESVGPGRWTARHPAEDPEGRDVIFSGQLLAQMIMATEAAAEGENGEKPVKSIHAVFARAGRYSAGPLELMVGHMHSGRAWASDTVTAVQGDQLLSRGLVLLNAPEPDLMRHSPAMPGVPGPGDCDPGNSGVVFPGAEARLVEPADGSTTTGPPTMHLWIRMPQSYASIAANQAIVAWSQPGFIIGAAMRPHADTVDITEAHRSISTSVISHTAHFHEHADVGEWLLIAHEGAYAGHGRVFGTGSVFSREGALVSTFAQDSMARGIEGPLDWKRAM